MTNHERTTCCVTRHEYIYIYICWLRCIPLAIRIFHSLNMQNHNFPAHTNPSIQHANCTCLLNNFWKNDGFSWAIQKEGKKMKPKRCRSWKMRTAERENRANTELTHTRLLLLTVLRILCVFSFQVHVNWKSFKRQTVTEIPISNNIFFSLLFCVPTRAPAIFLVLLHLWAVARSSQLSQHSSHSVSWDAIFSRCLFRRDVSAERYR